MISNWVDITLLIIIGLSIITGLIRGFVKELIALCVWATAIWLAVSYSYTLTPWLQPYIKDKNAQTVVGCVLILLATLIAGGLFSALIGFILHRTGLSGTDRVLGMGFGFVRGVFIVALLIMIMKMTSLSPYLEKSYWCPKFDPLVTWLSGKMPDWVGHAKAVDNATSVMDESDIVIDEPEKMIKLPSS